MKRVISTLFVFSLLLVYLGLSSGQASQDDIKNLTQGLSDVKNSVVSEPVFFPSYLALPFSVLFGIDNGSPLSLIIIHLGVWILALIFVLHMANFVSYFKNPIIRLIASLIITTLMSVSGGFDLIIDLLQSFNVLIIKITSIKSYTIGSIIVFAIVVAILYLILYFSKKFFISAKLDKVESDAASAGLRIGALQKLFRRDNN